MDLSLVGIILCNRDELKNGIEAPVAIYGLFDGDSCKYIGKTKRPFDRVNGHKARHNSLTFHIIGWTTESESFVAERAAIQFMNQTGMAELNIKMKSPQLSYCSNTQYKQTDNRIPDRKNLLHSFYGGYTTEAQQRNLNDMPNKRDPYKKLLGFWASPSEQEQIKTLCKETGLTRANLIRALVRNQLPLTKRKEISSN